MLTSTKIYCCNNLRMHRLYTGQVVSCMTLHLVNAVIRGREVQLPNYIRT